jgi:hypothetical protein
MTIEQAVEIVNRCDITTVPSAIIDAIEDVLACSSGMIRYSRNEFRQKLKKHIAEVAADRDFGFSVGLLSTNGDVWRAIGEAINTWSMNMTYTDYKEHAHVDDTKTQEAWLRSQH